MFAIEGSGENVFLHLLACHIWPSGGGEKIAGATPRPSFGYLKKSGPASPYFTWKGGGEDSPHRNQFLLLDPSLYASAEVTRAKHLDQISAKKKNLRKCTVRGDGWWHERLRTLFWKRKKGVWV